MGSTDLNLLLDVGFNREVAEDGALYWNKEDGNLAKLINRVDQLDSKSIEDLSKKARKRIEKGFVWEFISSEYEKIFLKG